MVLTSYSILICCYDAEEIMSRIVLNFFGTENVLSLNYANLRTSVKLFMIG